MFAYAQAWLEWEHALAVSLSLPLREERYIGGPVLAVFDNLLPDNDGIRRRVAQRVGADGADAFSLLASLGRDGVGALQFLSDDKPPEPVGAAHGHAVSEDQIAAMLRNLARNPLGLDDEDEDFRLSIAGAQEKSSHRHPLRPPLGDGRTPAPLPRLRRGRGGWRPGRLSHSLAGRSR